MDNQQPNNYQAESLQPRSIMDNLKFWQLSTCVLIFLIIILGTYALTNTREPRFQSSSQLPTITKVLLSISPIPTPRVIEETEETIKWRTYVWNFYRFKYPVDWEVKEYPHQFAVFQSNNPQIFIRISKYTYVNPGETPDGIARLSFISNRYTLLAREEILVDGHKGIYQEVKMRDEEVFQIDTFIGDVRIKWDYSEEEIAPGTLSIGMYIQDLANTEFYRKTFNQILSTFKFPD